MQKKSKAMTPTERAQMSAMLLKLEVDAKADVERHRNRGAELRQAESEIEASKPHDPRCYYYDMKPVKAKAVKEPDPVAAALARAIRNKRNAAQR
ncbi:hypothetical protein HAP47_0021770 [Bradyrhizobium sp. 41S5]|uniref:hypothetical protein n=1 Tax=Bradyrhizobium sp. 41S5 TaxID=1404443 RepID=UPI00156B9374|nr:hypothetical protein [Bradyrhizobium sp. 41S5]UFX41928.1 hypothetical protein HAP47_0021770 [Bradyrhizobium sp. 41S5]